MGDSKLKCCILLMAICVSRLFAAPANPNATGETKALLEYLVSISGTKILSGQESMCGDGSFPSTRDKTVFNKTGKYPAIYTSDFGDGTSSCRKTAVNNAIAYSKAGSIIAFQYHMIQPDLADGSGFAAMNIPGSGYTKIPDILTEGSTLNTEFKKRLDELAGYFKTLEQNKIAVLWRPFHEMNGDWFWWSFQPRFKELWIYEWNYLTNVKKCNNLLWVFGINWYSKTDGDKKLPSYYYPGHEYVDVLGCDFYTAYGHAYDQHVHDTLRALGGGKPIAIAENGTMPDIAALRATQPYWTYWCTWWGFEGANKGNTDALYAKNYSDAAVITQDEVSIPVVSVPFTVNRAAGGSGDDGSYISTRRNGLFFTSNNPCGRIFLYAVNGKRATVFQGNSGVISADRFAAGTYIIRTNAGRGSGIPEILH